VILTAERKLVIDSINGLWEMVHMFPSVQGVRDISRIKCWEQRHPVHVKRA